MSAFDILHQHYALSAARRSEMPVVAKTGEIPAEVLGVLAKHKCDGESGSVGAMAMEVYALGKMHGEGKASK